MDAPNPTLVGYVTTEADVMGKQHTVHGMASSMKSAEVIQTENLPTSLTRYPFLTLLCLCALVPSAISVLLVQTGNVSKVHFLESTHSLKFKLINAHRVSIYLEKG